MNHANILLVDDESLVRWSLKERLEAQGYARRYGLQVIATVIPSRSTRGQASAGETAALVRTIRREKVPAVFAESSVNADVEEAIAREAGAKVSPPLWADALGPRGSSGATYIGSMRANTRTIVSSLGGDAGRCT